MLILTIRARGVRVEVRVTAESEPPAPLAIIETTGEEAPATRPSCRLAKAQASNVVQLPARVA